MKPTGATKEATGHSPLPWQLVEEPSDYADESAGSHYSIWAANDMTIALTVGDCVPHEEGNARLIVTAVNEHERLRVAVIAVLERFQREYHDLTDGQFGSVEDFPEVKQLRAALNDAEG